MKGFKTLFSIMILVIIAILIFSLYDTPKFSSGGTDEFSGVRIENELMRYRDPNTGMIPSDIRSKELQFASRLPGSLGSIKKGADVTLVADWQKRGPYEVGGRTRALVIDIRNESVIYAAGVSSGIWKSVDAGQTWKMTTRPDQLKTVSCMVQDTRPGKEDILYAGTGEFWGNSARISGDGIYKSVDGGETWEILASTSTATPNRWDNTFDYVWSIAIDPTNQEEDVVLAATTSGAIMRSSDGGGTWGLSIGGFGNNNSYFTEIAVSQTGVFYATLSQYAYPNSSKTKGIFRSTDGINWADITPQDMPLQYKRVYIGIAPSDENQVYFIAESPNYGKLTTNSMGDSLWHSLFKYTYISGDGTGGNGKWENRTVNIPRPEKVRWHMNSQSSYNLLIAVKPDDPDFVILGGTNLYRSTDGFATDEFTLIGGTCPDADEDCWYFYRYPNQHADQHAIVFSRNNSNIMYSGTDGGVHKTLDVSAQRVEWISLNNGYYTTQFYSCAIDHATQGSSILIGGLQDNGTLMAFSKDLMEEWKIPTNGDGLSCAVADGGKTFYSSQNSSTSPVAVKMWRFTVDENGEKDILTRIDPAGGVDFIWNHYFGLDPNDSRRMYVGGGKIMWRNNNLDDIPFVNSKDSTDINWDSLSLTRIDSGNSIVKRPNAEITAGAISKTPADMVYYGTSQGEIFRLDNADEGNPVPVNITPDFFPYGFMSCITVHPDDGNKVIAVFSNYGIVSMFYSENAGADWVPVSGNLEETENGAGSGPAINWVRIITYGGRNVYLAGTSVGLFVTANFDGKYTVWQQEGAETIGNTVVRMIDSRESDRYVVVATHGLGVFGGQINSFPASPLVPELVSPANNTGGITDLVNLEWTKAADAVYYKLEIASDPEFNNIIHTQDGIKSTTFQFKEIVQGLKDHYWRVLAKNAGGNSIWSEVWKFSSAVSSPTLILPENKAQDVVLKPELSWSPVDGADSYHLLISDKFHFNSVVADTIVNENKYQSAELFPDQRYYWKVSSISGGNEGLFSDPWIFNTEYVLSVKDWFEISGDIEIYPNPVKNNMNIAFNLINDKAIRIYISDIMGNIVHTAGNKVYNSGNNKLSINAGYLNPGKYFLIIESGGYKKSKSFVLVK